MPTLNSASSVSSVRIALCLLSLVAFPATASAYIDPGTGSLLFQSLLAVLFGIGVAFRKLHSWIAQFWAWLLRRPRPDDTVE